MNTISRREMFRTSSLVLAAPFVGSLSMDAMGQTIPHRNQTNSNLNPPPYSNDLETYVNNGLTHVFNLAKQYVDQSADWDHVASLSFFYALHLEASGVNSAYTKSISAIDQTAVFISQKTKRADIEYSLNRLKSEGLVGIIQGFSSIAKDHSRSLNLNRTLTGLMSGRKYNHTPRYKSGAFYPAVLASHSSTDYIDNRFVNKPGLLKVVAHSCNGGQKLTPAQCQARANELQSLLALSAAWGCAKTGPAAYGCTGLLATIAAMVSMLNDYCQGNPW